MNTQATTILAVSSLLAAIGGGLIETNLTAGIICLVLGGVGFFVREYFKLA